MPLLNLAMGLEGLIHVSQLSSEKITDPEEAVKVDDDIKAKVIKVDIANKKDRLKHQSSYRKPGPFAKSKRNR